MVKISPETRWTKNQLIEYDADNIDPIKMDLCAALASVFLELNKNMPRRKLEDVITCLTGDDDLQKLFDIFVDLYEEIFGEIKHPNGRVIKSTFSQVKIGVINDGSTHSDLIKKLTVMVEYLK